MSLETSSRRADLRPLALAAALLLAGLVVVGVLFHPIEEAGTAERDGFVAQADLLRAGEVPRDAFRPLLYPLAVAALAGVVGDTFTAARLLSNLAAVALALLAWAFGHQLAPRRPAVAWWAFALVALNPNLWILGQHASTDMFFAALAAASLLLGWRFHRRPMLAAAVLLGGCLGLAAFTRGTALFLLPPVIWALWAGRRRPLLWLAAGLALGATLAPHFWLRFVAFGDPFHDDNWKNLAFKLYGYPDWTYLDRVPFTGLLDILWADPLAVLVGALREAARFAVGGLKQLLGTPLHALLLVVGSVVAWRRPASRGAARWLLFASAVFLAGLCLTFFAWGRLVLPLLPLFAALSACAWCLVPEAASSDRRRQPPRGIHHRWPRALAAGVVLLLAVKTFAFRLPAFVERHPRQELALLERLAERIEAPRALAGTMPFAGRDLPVPYVAVPDALGELAPAEAYYRALRELFEGQAVDYLVVSRLELRQRPPVLLTTPPPVAWLEAVEIGDGVAAWRVLREAPEAAPESRRPEASDAVAGEAAEAPSAAAGDLL